MGTIDSVSVSSIDKLSSMRPEFGEYNEHFEQAFLQQSCRYVRRRAQVLVQAEDNEDDGCFRQGTLDLTIYLQKVEAFMQHDMEQAKQFLPAATLPKLRAVYVYELIIAQSALMQSGTPCIVERALLRALQHQHQGGKGEGEGEKEDAKAFMDDEALVTLTRACRLFSLADEIFPPHSLYQYEHLDSDISLLSFPSPREKGQLLPLLEDSFFVAGVKEGCQLLTEVLRGRAGDGEGDVEAGGSGGRSKRGRESTESGGGGGEEGVSEPRKRMVPGGQDLDRDNTAAEVQQLELQKPVRLEHLSSSSSSSSSSAASSTLVSPPLKRHKSHSLLSDYQTPKMAKKRHSGSGRKSSSVKKLQKSRVLAAEEKYVTEVLRMLKIFNDLIVSVFQNKPLFIQTVKKISRDIVNKSEVTVADGSAVNINQVEIFVGYSDRRVNVSISHIPLPLLYTTTTTTNLICRSCLILFAHILLSHLCRNVLVLMSWKVSSVLSLQILVTKICSLKATTGKSMLAIQGLLHDCLHHPLLTAKLIVCLLLCFVCFYVLCVM